ncbi:hypothetical protein [Streptomyces sp. NPDC001652]|uniref:hypothetical protein n=1 Tax=Streptomyces sp. NPDC001652 TaxID=3154393 RepID=UPI0033342D7D
MTYSFRLTRTSDAHSPAHLYRGEVDGQYEVFLILDERSDSICPADSNGVPIPALRMSLSGGSLSGSSQKRDTVRGFPLLAAHLAAEWQRRGQPPQEVRKYFG